MSGILIDLRSCSGPLRVLIAEDNVINQKIALRYLEKMGLRADAVANGLEVLDALRSISYDLVLMDCQMPEMDGLEATKIIRASKPIENQKIPIIAMTANALKGDRERCMESGMSDYVSKPVAQAELFSVLRKWLGTDSADEIRSSNDIEDDSSVAIVDRKVIAELEGLDTTENGTLVDELVTEFLRTLPVMIKKMTDAEQDGKFEAVASEAHQIKSSSANLGAMKMASLSALLETAALTKDRGRIKALLNSLDMTFHETGAELSEAAAKILKKSA